MITITAPVVEDDSKPSATTGSDSEEGDDKGKGDLVFEDPFEGQW